MRRCLRRPCTPTVRLVFSNTIRVPKDLEKSLLDAVKVVPERDGGCVVARQLLCPLFLYQSPPGRQKP
jgi:hypothetical protein